MEIEYRNYKWDQTDKAFVCVSICIKFSFFVKLKKTRLVYDFQYLFSGIGLKRIAYFRDHQKDVFKFLKIISAQRGKQQCFSFSKTVWAELIFKNLKTKQQCFSFSKTVSEKCCWKLFQKTAVYFFLQRLTKVLTQNDRWL